MSDAPANARRLYDQESSCRRLLEQIQAMPQAEARAFCAHVLIHFCERLRKNTLMKRGGPGYNALGEPVISSFYQHGRKKRRWYDRDAVLHKAVGLLYGLSLEMLGVLGFKLGDTFGLIQVYATVCDRVGQLPDMREMAQICTTSLKAGKQEAEEVMVSIVGRELFYAIREEAME